MGPRPLALRLPGAPAVQPQTCAAALQSIRRPGETPLEQSRTPPCLPLESLKRTGVPRWPAPRTGHPRRRPNSALPLGLPPLVCSGAVSLASAAEPRDLRLDPCRRLRPGGVLHQPHDVAPPLRPVLRAAPRPSGGQLKPQSPRGMMTYASASPGSRLVAHRLWAVSFEALAVAATLRAARHIDQHPSCWGRMPQMQGPSLVDSFDPWCGAMGFEPFRRVLHPSSGRAKTSGGGNIQHDRLATRR